jgi:hypothetical protein
MFVLGVEDVIGYRHRKMKKVSTSNIRLYNKLTIIFFSTFGTPLFGAIGYSNNLSSLDKKNKAIGPILFGLVYNAIVHPGVQKFGLGIQYTFLPVNIIGGLILAFVFWKEQIDPEIEFTAKPIWIPLIIMLLIYGVLIGLHFFL